MVGSSLAPSYSVFGLPLTTLTLPAYELDSRLINSLLDGYRRYVECTPIPRIGLSLIYDNNAKLPESSGHIATILRSGGIISISQSGLRKRSNGICKSMDGKGSSTAITLQSLSINLPRLAFDSNRDEPYFRAKLALMIRPALIAMSLRKKSIADLMRKGMLPLLAKSTNFAQILTTNLLINLTGAKESIYDILGYGANNGGVEVLQKVVRTAVDKATEQGKQFAEDSVGVAMMCDDSAERFARLDSDKYGKTSLLSTQQTNEKLYSQGLVLNGKDLLSDDKATSMIDECSSISKLLNGGVSTTVDMSDLYSSDIEIKNAIETASKLAFFRPRLKTWICSTCGELNLI